MTPVKVRLMKKFVPFTGIMTMGLVLTQWQDTLGWGVALGFSALAGLVSSGVFALVFWLWETFQPKKGLPAPEERRRRR